MNDLTGKLLKDYRVLRPLGRGAMAEVYLAEQSSLARQVALKVLNHELADDPSYVARFHQEARAAAALVHGSIVQVYEVGRVDDTHFIAQEYVSGGSLGELIHRQARIAPGPTLEVVAQVAAALQKAAEHGIVHRDIKPENILLASNGDVKVADFGLARIANGTAAGNQLTQVGVTLGTPLYMSPEQIEGVQLDSRSDIYSLGVTAYHMLCGTPPHRGDTALAVAVGHLNSTPVRLEELVPDIPQPLARVVHRMMAKKPAQRYANPAELVQELQDVATEAARQGWCGPLRSWSPGNLVPSEVGPHDATTRLELVMKSANQVDTRPPTRRNWLMAIVGGIGAGAVLARATRSRWLLSDARYAVPQQSTVWAQLYHAKLADTEQAWLAVIDLFPAERTYYHDLARQGLSRHFMRTNQFSKALAPLGELAARTDSQGSFRGFGIAGLALSFARLGRVEDARQKYGELTSAMRRAFEQSDPTLSKQLDRAIRGLSGD